MGHTHLNAHLVFDRCVWVVVTKLLKRYDTFSLYGYIHFFWKPLRIHVTQLVSFIQKIVKISVTMEPYKQVSSHLHLNQQLESFSN